MARYELIERIGAGGMAEIFRGRAVAGGGFEKPVAIKRILPHLGQDKRFVELLIAEAKTLSQLRHRNIVQIYDVGVGDDGQYFLVMEYVDGMDLGGLFEQTERRRTKLPLEVSLHIAAEVCEALDHAYRTPGPDGNPLGLVHRDVSPSNVLVSRSGEVKLTDFGIAKRVEEATGHGGVRGKYAYISPEQSRSERVDARSDVYSLGIILFELCTGNRLFSALPDFDALKAVREARIPRPSVLDATVTGELEQILLTALAPDPADRFPTAGSFAAKLRGYRYSLEPGLNDPAVELAGLIARCDQSEKAEGRAPSGAMFGNDADEPTVLRIVTAAGFPVAELGDEVGEARPASENGRASSAAEPTLPRLEVGRASSAADTTSPRVNALGEEMPMPLLASESSAPTPMSISTPPEPLAPAVNGNGSARGTIPPGALLAGGPPLHHADDDPTNFVARAPEAERFDGVAFQAIPPTPGGPPATMPSGVRPNGSVAVSSTSARAQEPPLPARSRRIALIASLGLAVGLAMVAVVAIRAFDDKEEASSDARAKSDPPAPARAAVVEDAGTESEPPQRAAGETDSGAKPSGGESSGETEKKSDDVRKPTEGKRQINSKVDDDRDKKRKKRRQRERERDRRRKRERDRRDR